MTAAEYVRFRSRDPEVTFNALRPYHLIVPAPTRHNPERKALLDAATFTLPNHSEFGGGRGTGWVIRADGTVGVAPATYINVLWEDIPFHMRQSAIEQFHEWQDEIAKMEVKI